MAVRPRFMFNSVLNVFLKVFLFNYVINKFAFHSQAQKFNSFVYVLKGFQSHNFYVINQFSFNSCKYFMFDE